MPPKKQLRYQILGQYELSINERMMISRVRGPWNIAAIKAYQETAQSIIQTLAGAPWVVLAIVSGEPLHTSESIDALAKMIRVHRQLGRCGTALVFDGEMASARIYQLMISKMYTMSGEPYYFAKDEEDAIAWLKKQLAIQR